MLCLKLLLGDIILFHLLYIFSFFFCDIVETFCIKIIFLILPNDQNNTNSPVGPSYILIHYRLLRGQLQLFDQGDPFMEVQFTERFVGFWQVGAW